MALDNIQIILLVFSLILILVIIIKALKVTFKTVIIITIIYLLFKIYNPFDNITYFQDSRSQHELQYGTINYNHNKALIDYYFYGN